MAAKKKIKKRKAKKRPVKKAKAKQAQGPSMMQTYFQSFLYCQGFAG